MSPNANPVAGAEFQIFLILTALMPDARRELQNIIRLATHTALDGIVYTMNGSILVKDGKIAAVGENRSAPAGVTVVDAGGKFVTPGIIDSHSHIALDDDVNEATSPITPHMPSGISLANTRYRLAQRNR